MTQTQLQAENETFACPCGGEIQVKNPDYVLHRCEHLYAIKQFGRVLIPYTRVLLNPKVTGGQRKFNWYVDWS